MQSSQKHYHFIGISGIGMSGIAKILLQQGYTVSGCDTNIDNKHVKELLDLGCTISSTHLSSLCTHSSINEIVYSSVISTDHPELKTARSQNIPCKLRAEVLAEIMQHKTSIAVGGSHGKTSTSALVAHILTSSQLDPSIVIGGHVNAINTNAHHGSGKYLVAEADESDRSLLTLPKTFSLVTNIDLEHLETYKDFDDVKQTFITFMNSTPSDGINVICIDDTGIQETLPAITNPVVTYGTQPRADIQAKNIQLFKDNSIFDIYQKSTNSILGSINLPEPGIHYVLNATGAIALALHINTPFSSIQHSLATFKGVDRRFTLKGISKVHKAHIFDDYGHHPKEIEHALSIARKKAENNLIVVFQPHRFSRTKHLWHDFIDTFSNNSIDTLIIADIYPASEKPIQGICSSKLVQCIKEKNPHLNIIHSKIDQNLQTLQEIVHQQLSQNDLLLLLGAGKIHKIAKNFL